MENWLKCILRRVHKHTLGKDYIIQNIDGERCLYKEFTDGYDVEVSGLDNRKAAVPDTNIHIWAKTNTNNPEIIFTIDMLPATVIPKWLSFIERVIEYHKTNVPHDMTHMRLYPKVEHWHSTNINEDIYDIFVDEQKKTMFLKN